jgi:hypothetical protein
MKFQVGDAIDTALCVALKHEFLRCDDAFREFASAATAMITQGENRRIAYTAYNAYARFVHHLYEFMLSAIARGRHNTEKLDPDRAERYIASHTQRIFDEQTGGYSQSDCTSLGKPHKLLSRENSTDLCQGLPSHPKYC